jgi:hypothetical protein
MPYSGSIGAHAWSLRDSTVKLFFVGRSKILCNSSIRYCIIQEEPILFTLKLVTADAKNRLSQLTLWKRYIDITMQASDM